MNSEDAAALVEEAWRAHHQAVRDYLYRASRNFHLSEDLAAETFVRMLRYLSGSGTPPRNTMAWLRTVARNLLLDHYKAPAVYRELLTDEPRSSLAPAGIEHHVTVETWDATVALLDALTDNQRTVVVLRGIRDLSVRETAEFMGISDQAVRSLRHAAKCRLIEERRRQAHPALASPTEPLPDTAEVTP